MAFNDVSFLFLFFPVVLLLHKFMPMIGKNILLLLFSLLFFAWGSPEYLVLLLLYRFQLQHDRFRLQQLLQH